MKRALKKKSNIYAYLDSIKVLETGSEEAIVQARKDYWRVYKAAWRKKQRRETTQFIIAFKPSEVTVVSVAAKKHRRSVSSFIKDSCMSYIYKRYLAHDTYTLNSIRQHLAMNYNALQNLFDANIITYEVGKLLLQQMTALEKTVLHDLQTPKTLEEWIIETVKDSPSNKEAMITLIQNI